MYDYRPPLEHAPPIEKGKCKPLRGLIDGFRDFYGLFEDGEPPKKQEIEKQDVKKERLKKEKVVGHLLEQKEEVK